MISRMGGNVYKVDTEDPGDGGKRAEPAGTPYAVAMETACLAADAEVTLYPGRRPAGHMELAPRHARTFLKAHTPTIE